MIDTPCFTDFALQEYAFGRLDADVRREVDTHAQECEACRDSLRLIESEIVLLRAGLSHDSSESTDASTVDDESLALYLDGALNPADVANLEAGLLPDPALLARLVRLHAEIAATLGEQDDGVRRAMQAPPAGQILRMPKRTQLPVIFWNRDRKIGGA